MKYHDFTIEFRTGRQGGVSVSVVSPLVGEGSEEPFEAPTVQEELSVVARAAEARLETERSGVESPDFNDLQILSAEALRSLGSKLFEQLFRGSVRSFFDQSVALLAHSDEGLRIKIQIDLNQPELAPLHALPWEVISESTIEHALGLDRRFSIVRYIPLLQVLDRRPLPRPLRILLASAEPRGPRLLSLEQEAEQIRKAARPGEIEVQLLPSLTLEKLRRALTSLQEFHALHFMGHGEFDPASGEGVLYLEDGRRGAVLVNGRSLAEQLQDRTSLRLVFLNACRTARAAEPNPFGGVATALVRAGIPAVIAMQLPIADSAALAFSEKVYERLAAGDPIDAAVTEGRLAVVARAPQTLAWGTPVLFSRMKEGQLFVREGDIGPEATARKPIALPFSSLGSLFHGREEMLSLLHDRLAAAHSGRTTAIAGTVVHGLGGVGKTRLAVEYAWKYAEEYSALLFVGADSPADLQRNLAALRAPEVLDLPERHEKKEEAPEKAVLNWLATNTGWLLILDNVDSEKAATAVDALITQLHGGHLLLTGRLANWSADVDAIELDLLAEGAAVSFLLERTAKKRRPTGEDESQSAKIAQALGYLPLALEQAGAYIANRRLTLATYIEEWNSRRDVVLTWFNPRISRYPESVAVTWQTSVDQLSPPARRLLDRLAWLGSEPIPESLLEIPITRELTSWQGFVRKFFPLPPLVDSADLLREGLVELASYSLLNLATDAPSFSIHPLVQEVSRHNPSQETERASQEAVQWIMTAFEGPPQDSRAWLKLEALAPHARALVDTALRDRPFSTQALHLKSKLASLLDMDPFTHAALPPFAIKFLTQIEKEKHQKDAKEVIGLDKRRGPNK